MPADDARVDGQLHKLYAQADAARKQSRLLAGQLDATQRKTRQSWQLIQDSWERAELIRADQLAARAEPDRLQFSAYARLQARLTSMPVIEQAKGIIMARYGWPEDQAFDALRRVSQRENIKVRDLAASIVARAAHSATGHRQASPTSTTTRLGDGPNPRAGPRGSNDRYRAPA